jgi:glycosyltransferase involved in cell wall biosynthesis
VSVRLLFVSSTTIGGSGRSQRELAVKLRSFGHEVEFVVDDDSPSRVIRWTYEQLSDAAARWRDRSGAVVLRALDSVPGRWTRRRRIGGLDHQVTAVPENAVPRALDAFRPDVVVGNSLMRLTWRKIRELCVARGVPSVLYVREVTSLDHWGPGETPADLVVANAQSLAAEVRRRGVACAFVPSVIDTDVTRTESKREVVLAINPIESKGVDIVLALARRLPEVRFVLQESWPLDASQLDGLRRACAGLDNVELRRLRPAGPELYADARVVVVPYRVDSRPRVIAEAHANGIPVVTADVPALREAIGLGGVCVDVDDLDGWCREIERLWNDEAAYEAMCEAAFAHSRRPDIEPTSVARSFERLVLDLLSPDGSEPVDRPAPQPGASPAIDS